MKTVPTLRVVSKPDAPAEPAELGVADLPAEVRLALTDIAGAAREGLLAMSVAAGMAVMQTMFEAEIAAACGPKGRHDPDRGAVRHGAGKGSVVLARVRQLSDLQRHGNMHRRWSGSGSLVTKTELPSDTLFWLWLLLALDTGFS